MPTTASAVGLPFTQAIEFFRQKTNMPTKHWTAVMDEAHARSFAVAGAASQSLVQDFREAVDKAISQGTTMKEFRKEFDNIVAKHGWSHTGTADWRARIIYETNLRTAFAAGRYAQQTNPDVLAAFPYWEYLHVDCPHPRLQHLAWSGTVLRADDPWWNTNYPPNGWRCHCIVASLGARQLAKRGMSGPDQAPDLNWQTYTDRTTGVVTQYPAGVDPGFAYNPGKAWADKTPQPVRTPRVRADGPPPPVLAPLGATAVPGDVLKAFIAKPAGAVQVGMLDAASIRHLATRSAHVLLSDETLVKQMKHHPEFKGEDYEGLDDVLKTPLLVVTAGRPGQLWIYGEVGGQMVRLAVKRTRDRRETYLVSAHRIGRDSFHRQLLQAYVLAGSATAVEKNLE